ncbi:hypothetical protein D3C79_935750 [compost metagenome]
MTLSMVSKVAVMMRLPPGVPTTITTLPSLVTMVGLMDDSGALPGAMALASPCTRPYMFGTPIFEVKSSISSLRMTPVLLAITPAPNQSLRV